MTLSGSIVEVNGEKAVMATKGEIGEEGSRSKGKDESSEKAKDEPAGSKTELSIGSKTKTEDRTIPSSPITLLSP